MRHSSRTERAGISSAQNLWGLIVAVLFLIAAIVSIYVAYQGSIW